MNLRWRMLFEAVSSQNLETLLDVHKAGRYQSHTIGLDVLASSRSLQDSPGLTAIGVDPKLSSSLYFNQYGLTSSSSLMNPRKV